MACAAQCLTCHLAGFGLRVSSFSEPYQLPCNCIRVPVFDAALLQVTLERCQPLFDILLDFVPEPGEYFRHGDPEHDLVAERRFERWSDLKPLLTGDRSFIAMPKDVT